MTSKKKWMGAFQKLLDFRIELSDDANADQKLMSTDPAGSETET
jgi:hypothetical protein